MVGAIALWNTVYLARTLRSRTLRSLARRGAEPDPALLAHLAPLGWQHINLTGDYLWPSASGIGPNGFRPLKTPARATPLAAE